MMLLEYYKKLRQRSEEICKPLQTEDYVVQPVADVSPPKWHLGHSTWFFETFVLTPHLKGYRRYNADFDYIFNSYYETLGARVLRTDRGNLSRPTIEEVYRYRSHIDDAMTGLLNENISEELSETIVLGFNHEEQHQELLCTDIKYILGHNPLFPAYAAKPVCSGSAEIKHEDPIHITAGIYDIGFEGSSFCFDNELSRHKVYLHDYRVSASLVTNGEYLEFMVAGGYKNFRFWHAEGWDWVNKNNIKAPLYWHLMDDTWMNYTLQGLEPVDPDAAVCHVSYYEAAAYAAWKGARLPTEFEWEVASPQFNWGKRWEWTESAYLPYPGFKKAEGAIGEYNGKFMVNQKVLRGASEVTPPNHSRNTYRNFFHPHLRWQYTGVRLSYEL